MAVAETEGSSSPVGGHRGLSEWWSEETEYVLQRIERWAAYARGYNRLRSQRLSRGRMTMQDGRGTSSRLLLEESSWGPDRLEAVRGSHRRKPRREEETRLNCCGPFSYQSNSNLDSSCLESYRYDHSIYFKTIGDIKGSGRNPGVRDQNQDQDQNQNQDRNLDLDRVSISSEELVEWDIKTLSESIGEFVMERYLQERKDLEGFDTGTNLEEVEPSSSGPLVDRGTIGETKQEGESEDLDVGTNSEEPEPPSLLGPLEDREADQQVLSATEPREENNNRKGQESEGHDTGTNLGKSVSSARAPVVDVETSQTGLDAVDSKWTTGERGAKVSFVQNNEIESNDNNNSNENNDGDDDYDKLTVAIEISESIITADTLVEFENYDGNGNSEDGLRWFVGFQRGGGSKVLPRSCPVLPNCHGRGCSHESSGSQP